MEQIEPAYATFDQSKKLKEKEFNQRTKMVWLDALGQHLREVHLSLELNYKEYNAPEQWQIVEWLRINHGIWVYVNLEGRLDSYSYFIKGKDRDFPMNKIIKHGYPKFNEWYISPQEAYSAAFDYILKELI
jgi:hypothetical protein